MFKGAIKIVPLCSSNLKSSASQEGFTGYLNVIICYVDTHSENNKLHYSFKFLTKVRKRFKQCP